jgi:hypothetical protein
MAVVGEFAWLPCVQPAAISAKSTIVPKAALGKAA